jgi:predicted GNAT family acetyltransferase
MVLSRTSTGTAMTELLDNTGTEPPVTTAPADAPKPLPGPWDDKQAADTGSTRQERDLAALEDALASESFESLSTRELRVLANAMYRLTDSDHPPTGASERYDSIIDELEHRIQHAGERDPFRYQKESFRDNAMRSRFELYVDGRIAAYLKYSMHGGQINLVDGAEHVGFRDQGLDMTLMRNVMLNAHKRRLSIVPQCPMAFSFLADNPQYRTLAALPRG